jgi:ankyrin repeat protein
MSRLLGHWDPDRALEGMLSGTRLCWGLHLIAYFGLESLFHVLIGDLGDHVNSKIRNWTPLMMATYYRHRPIVRLLLEREDVDVNLGSGGETG